MAALESAKAQLEVRRSEHAAAVARLMGSSSIDAIDAACCIEIRAPATGVILKITQQSEGVTLVGTPLLEIGDPRDLEIVADLLSTAAVQIKQGASVRIDGWGGQPLQGRVARVEPDGFAKVWALGIEEQRVRTVIDFLDPLSDAKGDVFTLAGHLGGIGFPAAVEAVRSLVGHVPATPSWNRPKRTGTPLSITDRWRRRRPPTIGSRAWRYLADERAIPICILQAAIAQGLLREGPSGSVWTAHVDRAGQLIGWEERGPQWRGFSTGGSKELFRLGNEAALRFCVTEAAIDALSLAALEGMRADTLYISTGGGWSPASEAAIRAIAASPDILIAAATDNDRQGEVYAGRLQEIVRKAGCRYERLRPSTQDWNSDLEGQRKGNRGMEGETRAEIAAACPAVASREAAPG